MKKYLVASHGNLASGIRSSVEILSGLGQEIQTIDAYLDESDYTEKIDDFIKDIAEKDQGIIFTDLYGGSVNQKVFLQVVENPEKNIFLISGVNLGIVMSVVLREGALTKEVIQGLIEECQVQLVETNLEEGIEEADFF